MVRILTLCALIAPGLGVVTGCTSADTESDYVDTLNGVQERAFDTFNQTVNATSGDPAQQAKQLEAAGSTYDDVVAELESVEVPEEVQAAHRDLVNGYDDLRKVFDDAVSDVRKADDASESIAAINTIGIEGAAIAEMLDDALSRIRSDLD